MFVNVGFIGSGNMGSALAKCAAKGIARRGIGKLYLTDADHQKADKLAGQTKGISASNTEAAEECNLLFLAIKPQMLTGVLEEIKPILCRRTDRFVLASMVAGVEISRIQELLGCECPVIRIMPNTAVAVGAGMIQMCAQNTKEEEINDFCELMGDAGMLDSLPEHLIDAASAVSGCGPAYLCLALEGMADGGVALGLSREKALRYAAQTIYGLGKLALETNQHPGVLKDQVTSPGGTTIQGVRALENYRARAAFIEAVIASFEKTDALKKQV